MGPARLEAGCPPAIFADAAGLVFPETKKSELLVVSRAKSGWAKVPHDVIPLRLPSRPHRWQQTMGRSGPQPLSSERFIVDFRDQWWTRSVVSSQDILIAPDFAAGGRATRLWPLWRFARRNRTLKDMNVEVREQSTP